MSIAVVEALKAQLHDQPKQPLRPHQVREHEDELVRLGAVVKGRDMDGTERQWISADKPSAQRQAQRIRRILDTQAPKPLTGERANTVKALADRVLDEVLRPALLPRNVMRRNPPGAVGHVLKTEFSRPFKEAALAWKSALRALDPTNEDPDFTNLERHRPDGTPADGTSSVMTDAQIPGHFAQTPRAKANWPLGAPTADTAIAQVARREAAAGVKTGGKAKVARELPVTARCEACGRTFTGGFGPKNLTRHMAKEHAAVTAGGAA